MRFQGYIFPKISQKNIDTQKNSAAKHAGGAYKAVLRERYTELLQKLVRAAHLLFAVLVDRMGVRADRYGYAAFLDDALLFVVREEIIIIYVVSRRETTYITAVSTPETRKNPWRARR